MKRTNLMLLCLILLVVAISVGAVAFGESQSQFDKRRPVQANPKTFGLTTTHNPPSVAVQTTPEDADGKVLLLTITSNGFAPKELTIPAGDYLVVVRNRSGLEQFGARLERESGEILREVRVTKFKRDWKHFARLARGTYVIRETNHPHWTCRINITD
jgi:hypothetical protein